MITEKKVIDLMKIAEVIAQQSKDPSTKTGAIIVDRYHRTVSTGYNGYPRGVHDDRLDDREYRLARTLHAELNAILFSRQDLTGCIMICTHHPCSKCAAAIIQTGIDTVITKMNINPFTERWKDSIQRAGELFYEAKVKLFILGDK